MDVNFEYSFKTPYFSSSRPQCFFIPFLYRHHVCASAYGQIQPGNNVNSRHFTALCDGDEGGPLTVTENGRFVPCIQNVVIFMCIHLVLFRRTLIGIFSFADYKQSPVGSGPLGISCEPKTPQIFTAVAPLVDWINENTKGKGSTPWRSNCQGHELGCVTHAQLRTLAGSG